MDFRKREISDLTNRQEQLPYQCWGRRIRLGCQLQETMRGGRHNRLQGLTGLATALLDVRDTVKLLRLEGRHGWEQEQEGQEYIPRPPPTCINSVEMKLAETCGNRDKMHMAAYGNV